MPQSLTKSNLLHNKKTFLAPILVILIIAAVINHPQIMGLTTTLTPSEVISITNATRQTHGLAPLHPQVQLMQAAEAKAQAMITANAWSHNTPSETPWQFIQGEGYSYSMAGENLAKGFDSAQAVVNAWYNSPSHQANLLNAEYTDTGVAVIEAPYQNKAKTTLIVQFLAKASDVPNNDLPNQPPLLINPINSNSTYYYLIGLFTALTLVISITLLRKKIHSKHTKRLPDSSYWKR